MSNVNFSVNVDADAVNAQYEAEQNKNVAPKKTQFDEKNYLQARLSQNETSKTLTIRLLPFSPEGGSPFQKVYMHTVKVNKEVSPSGWKTFVCPAHNKKDGEPIEGACPFCETSAKARELKFKTSDETTKKRYGDVEFLNRAKEMWIVRCIERDHEADGVKFWLFNSSKKKDGVYDKIMNLSQIRSNAAAKKGNKYSIFDLNNGLDLIVTLTRTADNKTAIQIVDEGIPSPLTDNMETGMKWINDEKKWYDVYTVKSYDYMSIIAMGGIPVYDKELGKYVDKEEMIKAKEEAEQKRIENELTEETTDFSKIVTNKDIIIDGTTTTASTENTENNNEEDEEDLPF